jgi:hypothetical protein
MIRALFASLGLAAALTFSTGGSAQQGPHGTGKQARAMLDRVVASVKADQALERTPINPYHIRRPQSNLRIRRV